MVLGTPHGVGRTSCRTLPIEAMRLMRSACEDMGRVKAGMGFVGIVHLMIMSPTLPHAPILVGHSMGGYVVQKYLETHQATAGVLLASAPVSGLFGFIVRFGLRHPWPLLKSQLLLNSWPLIETPELAQDAFFSLRMSAAEIARHVARLQPESLRVVFEMTLLNLPRPKQVKTPMLVLAAENDQVFSVAEEQATAIAYGTEAIVFPDMAHDMMLEPNWQQVADRILDWLRERDL